MYMIKKALRFIPCLFILIAFIGCATSASNNIQSEVYHPKLPVGIETMEAAIKDLARLLENRADFFTFAFYPQYFARKKMDYFVANQPPSPSWDREIIEGHAMDGKLYYFPSGLECRTKTIGVRDDMLELSFRLFVSYADLPDLPITVKKNDNGTYRIILGDQIGILIKSQNDLQRVADDLFFIQQNYQKYNDPQFAFFETQAARYRALAIKPAVSEEQRKYIVQADALTRSKEYGTALRQYLKAVELDPVSYPKAYFNMALLSEQGRRFPAAVRYMKQYLMLVPDAPDARSAQDKIYEWEFMMPQRFTKEAAAKLSTEPPDAFLEVNVSDSGKGWTYLGRAPKDARFWRTDPALKFCLIRASKPGFYTEEKSFPFEALPAEVHIQLRKSGSGQDSHGYLGIAYQVVTEELAKSLGFPEPRGLWVKEVVKDSPAAEAGLEHGDIIFAFNGEEIKEMIDLPRMTAATPVGKMVNVSIFRNGQKRSCNVKIGKLPD